MTLTLSIGDFVSNKAGDNQGKIMAVCQDGAMRGRLSHINEDGEDIIIAVRWNTPSIRDRNIVWYDLAQMEACGMKKLEKPVTVTCATCGHTREGGKS